MRGLAPKSEELAIRLTGENWRTLILAVLPPFVGDLGNFVGRLLFGSGQRANDERYPHDGRWRVEEIGRHLTFDAEVRREATVLYGVEIHGNNVFS